MININVFSNERAWSKRLKNKEVFFNKVCGSFTKIFIHGFLHLLDFDHKKNKDYIKMLKEELQIYKSVISKTK